MCKTPPNGQTDKQTQQTCLRQIRWRQENAHTECRLFLLRPLLHRECTTTDNYRCTGQHYSLTFIPTTSLYTKVIKGQKAFLDMGSNDRTQRTQRTNGHLRCVCSSVCPLDWVWHYRQCIGTCNRTYTLHADPYRRCRKSITPENCFVIDSSSAYRNCLLFGSVEGTIERS